MSRCIYTDTIAGRLSDSSVRRSAAIDVSVRGLAAAGGIAGKTEAGAMIENCYVTGKVQEDMYLISVPSQLMIGSLNRYESYLNKDGNERQRMRRIAEEYAEKMSIFYGVSSQWMSGSAETLNSFVNIQFYTRMTNNLSYEQQAAVAVQAEHTEAGNNSMKTVYRRLTADEIRGMDLKDMEDLWDNRISIRTSQNYPETVGTATDGSYGFESFYCMNWYQSHNDNGSPDTHSFKRLGREMLGVAGYEKGYMVYMSALSENDLDALRKITGDDTITWKNIK